MSLVGQVDVRPLRCRIVKWCKIYSLVDKMKITNMKKPNCCRSYCVGNFWLWGVWGLRVGVWVECCTVVYRRHFLFTCSDTFAVRCIV